MRISLNGQSGMPWLGVDFNGNVSADIPGGAGSTLVVDVPVTTGEVLQAGTLAGAVGGSSPEIDGPYSQDGNNGPYDGGSDPGGSGGFAQYVTAAVSGGCPHAVAVAAGGGGAGAIGGGGGGGNADTGNGATGGGNAGNNDAVDGGGGGGASATGGGSSGAHGHSTSACHNGNDGEGGGFLSGGNGGGGTNYTGSDFNPTCDGGGGGGGGGAGYYYGGGGGSGYNSDPSGGGGGGESFIAPGATLLSQGTSSTAFPDTSSANDPFAGVQWTGYLQQYEAIGCSCFEEPVVGASTPPAPTITPHLSTTVSISSSLNPAQKGKSVTITATVNTLGTGSATSTAAGGTVTIYENNGQEFTAATPVVNGMVSVTTSALAPGDYQLYALYSGFTGSEIDEPGTSSGLFDQNITTPLIVTPANQTITFGQPDPTFGFTVTGYLPGDGSNVFTTEPVCGVAGAHTAGGTYTITCSGGVVNPIYSLDESATATFTVIGPQAIVFTSTPPSNPQVAQTYTVTATGGGSGKPVTFSTPFGSACTVTSSGLVTFTSGGPCRILANQAAGTGYTAAPQVEQDVTIPPQANEIFFTTTPPSNAQVGRGSYTVEAYALSGFPVSFYIDPTSTGYVAGHSGPTSTACTLTNPTSGTDSQGHTLTIETVTFTGVGTCVIDGFEGGDGQTFAAAPEVQQTITIAPGLQAQAITVMWFNTTPPGIGGSYTPPTATGGGSGNPVIVSTSTPNACTMSGSTVLFVGAGECIVDFNQAGNSDYFAAPQQTVSFGIPTADQTISFPAPTGIHVGEADSDPGGSASSGLPIDYSSTTTSVCTIVGELLHVVAAGSCTIDANQSGSTNYNAAPQVAQTFTIGPAQSPQAISFTSTAPASPIYGGTYSPTATGGGSDNPVTFSSTTTSTCSVSGGAVSFVGVGPCTIDADQAGSTSYTAAPRVAQTFTIAKKQVRIDATQDSKTYGASDPAVTGDYLLRAGDFVGSDSAAVVSGAASCSLASHSENAGTYTGAVSCAAGSLSATDYSFVAGTAANSVINPATLSVYAENESKSYGSSDPSLGYGLSGFEFSDTPTSAGISGGASCSRAPGESTGQYLITCLPGTLAVASDHPDNYQFAAGATATLTISAADQTISFAAPIGVTYGQADADLGASASSTLAVSYSSTTTSVCTIVGGRLHVVVAGSCTIDANQGGNGNYNAAPQVEQSFTIGTATPTVSWAAPAAITYGTALSASQLDATASTPGSFAYSPASGTVLHGGAGQALSVTFTPTDTADYSSASGTVDITVNAAGQSVRFTSTAPSSASYGGPAYTVAAAATSGLPVALSVDPSTSAVCALSGTHVTFIGAGTCTLNANQSGTGDYNAALQASQSFTVSKAPTTLGAVKGDKHIVGGSVTFFATLSRTDNKAPIAGETIAFSVRGGHGCSAKTASDGTARCNVRIGILRGLLSQSFSAVYAGSPNYKAISATGPLNAIRG